MLEASQKQIRKACLRNLKAAGALQGAHDAGKGMLLFYGAECGLKFVIMASRGEKTTKGVAADFGHNIRSLVTEAKIARSELAQVPPVGAVQFPELLRLGSAETVSLSEFHTAMRYGVELEQAGEAGAIEFFGRLGGAVRKRLTE